MKITLKANSRTSFKVPKTNMGDIFYTFEYGEERFHENIESIDEYEEAKAKLWESVNNEVAKQIQETLSLYKKEG